jgi:hypothetical protein
MGNLELERTSYISYIGFVSGKILSKTFLQFFTTFSAEEKNLRKILRCLKLIRGVISTKKKSPSN